MKDDRFRIGLLLSPIANLAKNLPNDLREQGDSSGQAILTFRLRAITAGIQGTLQAARGRETRSEPSTNPMSSNSSQADSAGSIPVTRSIRERRCSRGEFEDSSSPLICDSVHARATLGQRYPHLDTHPSVSEGRSACSVMFSSCPVLRFFRPHPNRVFATTSSSR
jgi:hypothetical protein